MTKANCQKNATVAITVSVVSHGHCSMVSQLLDDLAKIPEVVHVVLTLNILEQMGEIPLSLQKKLTVIENAAPKGFGANHNAAFQYCETEYFCVLNPDIRFNTNPFPALIETMTGTSASLAAPLVVNSLGSIEDSVRFFPTPFGLLKRVLGMSQGTYIIRQGDVAFMPDWVAGMCMLFRAEAYKVLQGFDEGFYLYYEDVDVCARSWKCGMPVLVCPDAIITHDAQRASHKSLRFLRWHVASMLRFFRNHRCLYSNPRVKD